MTTPGPDLVSTDLCRLHVRRTGTGPPVVLWHSLFFDSQSWGPLIDELARQRTVYAIDGPSHGKSESVPRDFTFDEVAAAAVTGAGSAGADRTRRLGRQCLGRTRRHPSCDGSSVADSDHHRDANRRVHAQGEADEGLATCRLYRFVGPSKYLTKTLSDSLLGADAVAAQPDQAAVIMASFRAADRTGMFHAMRSMMLHRTGIASCFPTSLCRRW